MSAPAKRSGQKRAPAREEEQQKGAKAKQTVTSTASSRPADDEDELEFEDPYGDEMEEEDVAAAAGKKKGKGKAKGKKAAVAPADGDVEMDEGEDDAESDADEEILDEEAAAKVAAEEEAAEAAASKMTKYVWRPGADTMGEDEKLDYDSSAYNLLHRMRVDWPCLSFDVLPDQLGMFRTKYPHTLYLAAGTQADRASNNKVMLLKLSDLHKTKHDDRDEDEEDGEDSDSDIDDLDEDPVLEERYFSHPGGVNRLRVCPQQPNLIATHADTAKVHVWNAAAHINALDGATGSKPPAAKATPVFTFHKGVQEGYAMAWSPLKTGRMVTGDGAKNVWMWEMKEGGMTWSVDAQPFKGHSSSVEDLVWSPSESSVFASASTDKTIRIWDVRVKEKCQTWIAAHKTDVNVMDWNAKVQHLLVSGSDDGSVKIWDLRNFKSGSPAAHFNWHRGPITSVEWHPIEESCLAAASADDSISIWDMALEHDELPGHGAQMQEDVPPQLFFVHQGQKQIKEIHWHKQIPNCLISTAEDGFNILKPSNMD